MSALKPQHEAFCQAYAVEPNGARAARAAGYAAGSAKNQAARILGRDDIAERVGEIQAEHAAERAELAARLIGKLEPAYDEALSAKDRFGMLQVVEMQGRLAGLLHGAPVIQIRATSSATRPPEPDNESTPFNSGNYIKQFALFDRVNALEDRFQAFDKIVRRMPKVDGAE